RKVCGDRASRKRWPGFELDRERTELVRSGGMRLKPRVRLGAVVALAIAAGVIAWLVVGRNDNRSPTTVTTSEAPGTTGSAGVGLGPVGVTADGLSTLVRSLNIPVYWAGPRDGYTYEVTKTATGKVYVRYLPPGVRVGDKRASFLIIATYPFPNAFNALKAVAGGLEIPLPGGGIAVVDLGYRKSVHV